MSRVHSPAASPYSVSLARARDLLEVVEGHRHQHRAEDLLAGDPHLVLDPGEQRGVDEVAVAVAVAAAPPADQLGALGDARVDVAADALELLLRRPAGRTAVSGSRPGPTFASRANSARRSIDLVEQLACTNRREPALQAWPELK